MPTYELTFLLNEETESNTIKELINSLKGKIIKEEKLGKKTLAFPIKKNTNAIFYIWQFEMEAKNLMEFKRKLNFNDKLIRYLLLTIVK